MIVLAFLWMFLCVAGNTGTAAKEEKKAENSHRPHSPRLYVDKPPSLPSDKSSFGNVRRQRVSIEDEELTDIKTEKGSGGTASVSFTSHGKKHHLDLTEGGTQLQDIDVRLLGASETLKQDVRKEMQNTKLMKDSKRGAMVAVKLQDDGSMLSIKRGVFQLGRHQFDVKSDIGQGRDKVRVKRKYVDNLADRKRDYVVAEDLQRSKRAIPESIEPISATVELVMILDYSLWNTTLSGDVRAENETSHMINLLLYYAHIADIMNVYYDTMKNDDITISVNLAGIVVLMTPSELPHLVEDHVMAEYFIGADSTLKRLTQWLNTSESSEVLPPGDHVMLFTGYDMYDEVEFSTGVVGLAWAGTICDRAYSSSLIEMADVLTFDASTAAHELGHSLGSQHDGDDESTKCEDKNFIMAAFAGNEDYLTNRFLFSCCSQRSFYATVHQSGSCLLNSTGSPNYPSSIDDKVTAYLPGQIFDADDQCYIAMGTKACNDPTPGAVESSICLSLWCESPADSTQCITSYTAAADGTSCGDNKWCSLGACVDEGTLSTTLDQQCDVNECNDGESRCANGVNAYRPGMLQCYLSEFTCDCFDDCTDGSDEVGCDMNCTCPQGFTKCTDGYAEYDIPEGVPPFCIFNEWVCDGEVDCSGGSDEINCMTSPIIVTSVPNTTPIEQTTSTPTKKKTTSTAMTSPTKITPTTTTPTTTTPITTTPTTTTPTTTTPTTTIPTTTTPTTTTPTTTTPTTTIPMTTTPTTTIPMTTTPTTTTPTTTTPTTTTPTTTTPTTTIPMKTTPTTTTPTTTTPTTTTPTTTTPTTTTPTPTTPTTTTPATTASTTTTPTTTTPATTTPTTTTPATTTPTPTTPTTTTPTTTTSMTTTPTTTTPTTTTPTTTTLTTTTPMTTTPTTTTPTTTTPATTTPTTTTSMTSTPTTTTSMKTTLKSTTTETTTFGNGGCHSCRRAGVCVTSVSLCEWVCPNNIDCNILSTTEPPISVASVNRLHAIIIAFPFTLLLNLY